jgi:hypothetical protein
MYKRHLHACSHQAFQACGTGDHLRPPPPPPSRPWHTLRPQLPPSLLPPHQGEFKHNLPHITQQEPCFSTQT